jgi:hypothetical protein
MGVQTGEIIAEIWKRNPEAQNKKQSKNNNNKTNQPTGQKFNASKNKSEIQMKMQG